MPRTEGEEPRIKEERPELKEEELRMDGRGKCGGEKGSRMKEERRKDKE